MQKFDYNNYDKIIVTTKLDKEQRVINDYALFGWEKVDRKEDRLYFDAVHLTFIREHKVPNKDRLQLLQVYYENYFNELSDYEKKPLRRSTSFILSALFIWVALAVSAVYMITVNLPYLNVLGWVILSVLVLSVYFVIRSHKRIKKKAKDGFNKKKVELEDNIDKILRESKSLIGGTYEK